MPLTQKEANDLLSVISTDNSVIIFPPFVYLSEIAGLKDKTKIKLGAQDVFYKNKGAYTGEISPKILKNLGVDYVIIGHSERRRYFGETDEIINKKIRAALKNKLKVILCVGEDLSIRKKGQKAVEQFIGNQLKDDLKNVPRNSALIAAYEPIWAIGTGHNDTPADAVKISRFIKQLITKNYKLKTMVLYGGSVDGKNIIKFINHPEIDGALIGHASVDKKEVKKIISQI